MTVLTTSIAPLQRPHLVHKFLVSITLSPTFKYKTGSSPQNLSDDNLFAFSCYCLLLLQLKVVFFSVTYCSYKLQQFCSYEPTCSNLRYFFGTKISDVMVIENSPTDIVH